MLLLLVMLNAIGPDISAVVGGGKAAVEHREKSSAHTHRLADWLLLPSVGEIQLNCVVQGGKNWIETVCRVNNT